MCAYSITRPARLATPTRASGHHCVNTAAYLMVTEGDGPVACNGRGGRGGR